MGVHITREEEHHHRPSRREDIYIREERRPSKHSTTHIDVELPHRRHHHHDTTVHIEGPQRRRYEGTQIDVAEREYRSRFQPSYREETRFEATVDPPRFQAQRSHVHVSEETVDPPRFSRKSNKMGYYDEDGGSRASAAPLPASIPEPAYTPNTVT